MVTIANMESCHQNSPWIIQPVFCGDNLATDDTWNMHPMITGNSYEENCTPLYDISLSTPTTWLDEFDDLYFNYNDLEEFSPRYDFDQLIAQPFDTSGNLTHALSELDWRLIHDDFDAEKKELSATKHGLKKTNQESSWCDMFDEIKTAPSLKAMSSHNTAGKLPTSCPYPECKSKAKFNSRKDLRNHYQTHCKRFFCRYPECSQSALNADPDIIGRRGFVTRKDRTRHEAKHKPEIQCQWRGENGEQCSRIFSRVDNMRDHVKRIHVRRQNGGIRQGVTGGQMEFTIRLTGNYSL